MRLNPVRSVEKRRLQANKVESGKNPQRGFALIEIVVALPLMTLVASTAIFLLLQQSQSVRSAIAHSGTTRELRHARILLSSELSALSSADILAVSDTLIEYWALMGSAVVCAVTPSNDMIISTEPNGVDSTWAKGLRAGDTMAVWAWPVSSVGEPLRTTAVLSSDAASAGMGRCSTIPNSKLWRVSARGIPPNLRFTGSPARFQRLTRYSHYKSGKLWWLGRKTWRPTGWEITQPVVGPLSSTARGGFSVTSVSSEGRMTANSDSIAALRFRLIAPRPYSPHGHAIEDTSEFSIALRGEPTGLLR